MSIPDALKIPTNTTVSAPFHIAGFTLIELMMTVAIVAILASVAYPSYQQNIVRSNRSEALQFMLNVANREEENLLNNRSYTDLTGLGMSAPSRLTAFYTFTASATTACNGVTLTAPAYCITATPVSTSTQKNDGTLTLDSQGNKKPVDKWK
jgi:type IV pilus assembly protein PilE